MDINHQQIEEAKRNLGLNGAAHPKGSAATKSKPAEKPAAKPSGYTMTEVDKAAREMLYDKRRARAFMKRQTPEVLHWLIDAANEVLPEVKERAEREKQERIAAKKFEIVQALAEKANELGVNFKELIAEINQGELPAPAKTTTSANTSPLSPIQKAKMAEETKKRHNTARYRYEIFGREYLWSGMGLPPKPFKCWLAKGNAKEAAKLNKADFFQMPNGYNASEIPAEFEAQANKLLITYQREIESKK